MTRAFCTLFDTAFLSRGLCLYRSLVRHCPNFKLYVLALSNDCADLLEALQLPRLSIIRVAEVEARYGGLCDARADRTALEYYFTLTPHLPSYVFDSGAETGILTYLDADTFLFSSPEPAFDAFGDNAIAITPHRFPPGQSKREVDGIYNVGWVGFRHGDVARGCLARWRAQCIEWCRHVPSQGRYADQGYLNDWPDRYGAVAVIDHPGVNAGPWRIGAAALSQHDGAVMIDGEPLVLFHFSRLVRLSNRIYLPLLKEFKQALTPAIRRLIYRPYVTALHAEERTLRQRFGGSFSAARPHQHRSIDMVELAGVLARREALVALGSGVL
jgi:hypothetical protein